MVTAAMARLQVLLDDAVVQCQDGHAGDGILVNFLLPTLYLGPSNPDCLDF